MTVRPDPSPSRAWIVTSDRLRRINYLAVMLVLPPVFLWNALRLDVPAERLLLVLSAVGPLASLVFLIVSRGRALPSRRMEPVIDGVLLLTVALLAAVHWHSARPELTSGALLSALLFPGYFMRWSVVYRDHPVRRHGLSAAYLLLTVAAVAGAYAHGHRDIDLLTVLLLGGLLLVHLSDFQRVARQVDLEREQRTAAEHTARHDSLTGLPNRRAFEQDGETLDPARRHSLIVLDIDHFKSVNDAHGHDVGDQVLAALATRLLAIVQHHGHAYRWGGEEFAILLPDTPGSQAAEIAETIRRRVVAQPMAGHAVTVSLGVGESHPELTPRENFVLVDTALRRAKSDGRNRMCHARRLSVPTHLH
ncbi:diguanylate cyclase [uncultured Deinococcus sp.]|uniref:GGDEF domain-containing protein n=1 Tax=uncultured Deinococcus sp. TaxID=158789 RepID=UPI0025F9CB06|nr:GGDEF domain-containing protein [uncultured Deinococcus sp.]